MNYVLDTVDTVRQLPYQDLNQALCIIWMAWNDLSTQQNSQKNEDVYLRKLFSFVAVAGTEHKSAPSVRFYVAPKESASEQPR